jgi:hypothetical protein
VHTFSKVTSYLVRRVNHSRAEDLPRRRNLHPSLFSVDTICINQSDNQERSQQVRNMRQIYSRAEEVFSWVGDGCVPRYLEPAVSVFNKMLLDLPENFPHRWPGNDSELFGVLGRLFGEQYWRRVWIIQEITVASKVTILYGDCRYRWEDVSAILRQLQNVQSTLSTTIAEAIERAGHLLKFRDGYTGRNLINLFDALVWSRRALATDPRDKIFALLGLCHDGPIFVPVPNYKQDLGTIIADMSRMMMSLNKTLDFICLRGIGSRMDQTLPR